MRSALAVNLNGDDGDAPVRGKDQGHKLNSDRKKKAPSSKVMERNVTPRSTFVSRTITPKGTPIEKGNEYTVDFKPGPIGLKLEPVLTNGKKEFGCKVMRFVGGDIDSGSPSQALKSGKINIGDVVTAVSGKNVTSKSYKDIVSILRNTSSSEGRSITFRVPRSPAAVMPKTPAVTIRPSSKESSSSSSTARKEAKYSADKKAGGHLDKPQTMFSPSFVKHTRQTSVKDAAILYTPRSPSKPLSDVLNTVIKHIKPAACNANTSHVASILSKQLGQVLNGRSSKEVDETVRMKMELLSELSQAYASLGEQEKNMVMMTKIMNDIHQEKVAAQAEVDSIQDTLSEVQIAKVCLFYLRT